jgi:hypothetical protein
MIVAAMRKAITVVEDILPAGVTREFGCETSLCHTAKRRELVIVGRQGLVRRATKPTGGVKKSLKLIGLYLKGYLKMASG